VPLFLADYRPMAVCARPPSGKDLTLEKESHMATSELDTRRVRAAKNQSLFRDLNERIEDISERLDLTTKMIDFVCECAHPDCAETVEMTQTEYESIRRIATHFAIKAGHEIADVEQVMAGNARYIVVSKLGAAGEAATQLDPRGREQDAQADLPG
jgi:hypothetical protein